MSASTPANPLPPRRHRYFYPLAALAVLLVVFVGFAPSFYLKGTLGPARELSGLARLHGVVMTTWFVLFLVQAGLILRGRRDLHRRLGYFGGLVAVAMLVIGTQTALVATAGARAQLGTLAVSGGLIGILLVFFILTGLGLYWRKQREIHKRLMLLATVSLLGAAWNRFPFAICQGHGDLITELCIALVVVGDTWNHRRLHPACLWGGLFVIAANIGFGRL